MANPTWSSNLTVTAGALVLDANGNVQQAANSGITGATAPIWATAQGASTTDGTVVWVLVIIYAPALVPGLAALPLPSFVNDADGLDVNLIVSDCIAAFSAATGRVVYPAQVERLEINQIAYRESLVRNAIQAAGMQNLVAFAVYPMLDFLGQLVGVARLPSQPALTSIQFTLITALGVNVLIPAGTQVGTTDGAFVFVTNADLTIPEGNVTGTIGASCTTPGPNANGYLVGEVNVLLSPDALIASVQNAAVTAGGSDAELDTHLRTRIQQAPNTFGVAGPTQGYRAFALGVSSAIVDVQVTTPQPGSVNVALLCGPITAQPAPSPNPQATPGAPLIAAVQAVLSASYVRPLTDTVNVLGATEVDYAIAGTVTLYSDANVSVVTALLNAAAAQYAINQASRMQRNIVVSEIVSAISVPGVYEVTLSSPATDAILTAGQFANCTAIALTVTVGTEAS